MANQVGTVPSGSLCTTCSAIPPELFLPGYGVSHEVGLGRLSTATVSGTNACNLCAALRGGLRRILTGAGSRGAGAEKVSVRSEWSRSKKAVYQGWLAAYDRDQRICRLRFSMTPHGEWLAPFEYDPPGIYSREVDWFRTSESQPPKQAGVAADSGRRPLSRTPASDENFALMNRWLDRCLDEHASCGIDGMHIDEAGFTMPRRLIDTHGRGLRLVDSSTIEPGSEQPRLSYLTLSHCWGDASLIPKCTRANLRQLMTSIDFASLPRSFRDCITVARKLRVRYVWIDSLCILQDDADDKSAEVARMALIYSGSVCTVVAAAAPESRGGCFFDRGDQQQHDPRPFDLVFKRGELNFTVTVQPYLHDFVDVVSNGPVSTRGWCFQERQLSKRVIYFTEGCIAWECRDAAATEAQPEMVSRAWSHNHPLFVMAPDRVLDCVPAGFSFSQPNWLDHEITRRVLIRENPAFAGGGIIPYYKHWMDKWPTIVEEYSARALSSAYDRLPALGGLASVIAGLLRKPLDAGGNAYLAGLFRADLIRQLCWFPDVQDPRRTREKVARARWPPPPRDPPACTRKTVADRLSLPSWSWISVDGPVRYYDIDTFLSEADVEQEVQQMELGVGGKRMRHGDLAARLLEARIDLVVPWYEFGAVSAGRVAVSGLAVQVEIDERDLVSPGGEGGAPVLPKCYAMMRSRTMERDGKRGERGWASEAVRTTGVIFFDADPEQLPRTTVSCLRLGQKRSLVSSCNPVDVGLVLVQVEDARLPGGMRVGPWFRRVGMFETWNAEFLGRAVRKEFIVV